MKKVLVIGCPGSGKTTLSRKLAEKYSLPLSHFDNLYYKGSWDPDSDIRKREWRSYVKEIAKKDSWIIDGNYTSTLDIRIPAADTIIFLDYPRWFVFLRIFKRGIQRHHDDSKNKKGDMSLKLLRFVWQFKKEEHPKVLRAMHEYGKDTDIHILAKPKEAEQFLVF